MDILWWWGAKGRIILSITNTLSFELQTNPRECHPLLFIGKEAESMVPYLGAQAPSQADLDLNSALEEIKAWLFPLHHRD